jgi:hypothetical protein
MPEASTATLKVVRRGGYSDLLRSYKIFVNDAHVGTIARNDALSLAVPAGSVKVEARIDWTKSEPLIVDAAPNRTVEVEVSNSRGPWWALWGITFGARSYLVVRLVKSLS